MLLILISQALHLTEHSLPTGLADEGVSDLWNHRVNLCVETAARVLTLREGRVVQSTSCLLLELMEGLLPSLGPFIRSFRPEDDRCSGLGVRGSCAGTVPAPRSR